MGGQPIHQGILLIRHAEASGQEPDADLTPAGHRQARDLAERLRHLQVDGVVSSPYLRARNTVTPFATSNGIAVEIHNDLYERVLSLEPLPDWLVHVRRSFEDFDYAVGGGESLNATCDRALGALRDVLGLGCGFPAVVSHGNLIASILARVDPAFGFEEWRTMKNPDLFSLTFEAGTPVGYTRIEAQTDE